MTTVPTRKLNRMQFVLSLAGVLVIVVRLAPSAIAESESVWERPGSKPLVRLEYSNVPSGPEPHILTREPLYLSVINDAGIPIVVNIEGRAISGDLDETRTIDTLALAPLEERILTLGPEATPAGTNAAFSQLLIGARIRDLEGRLLGAAQAPDLFYYRDEREVTHVNRHLINRGVVGSAHELPKTLLNTEKELSVSSEMVGFGKKEGVNAGTIHYATVIGGGTGPIVGQGRQLCIKLKVFFTDVGFGEDYWTTNSDKSATGIYIRVKDRKDNTLFEGFTGDGVVFGSETSDPGQGCAWFGAQDLSDWTVRIYSKARVKNNEVQVYELGYMDWWEFSGVNAATAGPTWLTPSFTTDVINILAAASEGLRRHAGGMTGHTYKIGIAGSGGLTNVYVQDGVIYVSSEAARQKFTIVHGMGHALLYNKGFLFDGDVSYITSFNSPHRYTDDPCSTAWGAHSMTSKEYNTGALSEGFADFYAVSVWNNAATPDGVYVTGGTRYDVELGTHYMVRNCPSPYEGYGVEWDWVRFFWDFHTASSSVYDEFVPFDEILDIIGLASTLDGRAMEKEEAYKRLRRAVMIWNSGRRLIQFDTYAVENGIDH